MEIATHDYDTEEERQVDKLIALIDNGRNDDYRQSKSARVAQLAAMKKVGKWPKLSGLPIEGPLVLIHLFLSLEQMMSAGLMTPVTAPIMSSGQLPARNFNFKPLTPINELSSRIWDSQVGGMTSDSDGNCCKPKKKKKPRPTMPTLDLDPANLCKRENIYATPFYRQLSILLLRTFLLIWRDSSLTTMRFAIHLGIGCLIGFLYYGIGNDASNSMNNFRYVFYTIMFIMYCAFSGILVKCKSKVSFTITSIRFVI